VADEEVASGGHVVAPVADDAGRVLVVVHVVEDRAEDDGDGTSEVDQVEGVGVGADAFGVAYIHRDDPGPRDLVDVVGSRQATAQVRPPCRRLGLPSGPGRVLRWSLLKGRRRLRRCGSIQQPLEIQGYGDPPIPRVAQTCRSETARHPSTCRLQPGSAASDFSHPRIRHTGCKRWGVRRVNREWSRLLELCVQKGEPVWNTTERIDGCRFVVVGQEFHLSFRAWGPAL
jgi:hypothetical protein